MIEMILYLITEGLPLFSYYIGEAVLFLLTFGRRKPRWSIPEPMDTRAYLSGFVGFIVLVPIVMVLVLMVVEAFG